MVEEPCCLFLHLLLQQDVVLAVLVHVLQQVDTGLIFASPLLLAGVPLLLVLLLSEFVDVLLESLLVAFNSVVVLLELLDLPTAGKSLISFELLDVALARQSLIEEHLIAVLLLHLSMLAELLLSGVVADELKVPLAVQQELLVRVVLLLLFLDSPLVFKHVLLTGNEFVLLGALDLAGILLPVEDGHRVADLLLLLASLNHFSLELLLGVELPELGVDLLLEHLRLDGSALVNQLLLALDGSSVVVELGVFLAESVVGSLELHVLAAGHLVDTLLFTSALEVLESLEHLLANLLRRFQVVVKFLFVDSVLSGEELSEADPPLFEVDSLALTHFDDAVLHDVFVDQLAGLGLPMGLVSQAACDLDVV